MKRRALVFAAGVIAAIDAACPNLCSGQGTCGLSDVCECFPGFIGVDCSLRVCESGLAWGSDDAGGRAYHECSAHGTCDRASGTCQCFPGFTGRACARSECPNDCSGNGVCTLLKDMPLTVPYAASNWDASRMQACICDAGWTGTDCSQRTCPTGDDPLTVPMTDVKSQVQEIRFTLGSEVAYDPTIAYAGSYSTGSEQMDVFGTSSGTSPDVARTVGGMRVTYRDPHGGAWVAHAVDGVIGASDDNAQDKLEIALETLPGQRVKNVRVQTDMSDGDADGGIVNVYQRRFQVTFVPDEVSSTNVGLQNALECDTGYSCTEPGCQPIVKMPFLHRYAGTPGDVKLGDEINDYGNSNSPRIDFCTTDVNVDDEFSVNGKFLRLHPDSAPQMPAGVAVDTGVSGSDKRRYDMRILVAVMDPEDAIDNPVDVYYTRVIIGHQNITSENERVGFAPGVKGVWSAGKTFTTTLDGFTYNGPIPLKAGTNNAGDKVPVHGAPGVFLSFPKTNIVSTNGYGRWFEILIKLPHCTVTPMLKAGDLLDLTGTPIAPVDTSVENIECSGRGKCDRGSGECKCFTGYYGNACHRQTVLV